VVSMGLFPRPLSIKYIEFRDTILHSLKKVNTRQSLFIKFYKKTFMVILHKKARHFLALKEKVVVFGRCFLFIFCL
jgi:hypothetical protein